MRLPWTKDEEKKTAIAQRIKEMDKKADEASDRFLEAMRDLDLALKRAKPDGR